MAEDDRTFRTSTPAANRAEMQGLGVGQREMDAQGAPSREAHATDPQRLEPFEDVPAGGGAEGSGAPSGEPRAFDDRNSAGLGDAGDLGAATPANVDIHDLGQGDNPQEDWGEPADEGATHSANHTRRGVKTEAERGQGAKTRKANKDIVSRRG
ncbi:MAG TPA: hypothetical protein VHV27_11325 [Phenylobacterium sp.]|jgi:hypothetical protein|nr:hypothetical protein [Phenylobacterium sp.]